MAKSVTYSVVYRSEDNLTKLLTWVQDEPEELDDPIVANLFEHALNEYGDALIPDELAQFIKEQIEIITATSDEKVTCLYDVTKDPKVLVSSYYDEAFLLYTKHFKMVEEEEEKEIESEPLPPFVGNYLTNQIQEDARETMQDFIIGWASDVQELDRYQKSILWEKAKIVWETTEEKVPLGDGKTHIAILHIPTETNPGYFPAFILKLVEFTVTQCLTNGFITYSAQLEYHSSCIVLTLKGQY